MKAKEKHFKIVEKGLSADQLTSLELNSFIGGCGQNTTCPNNFVCPNDDVCPADCPAYSCQFTDCTTLFGGGPGGTGCPWLYMGQCPPVWCDQYTPEYSNQ